MNNQIRIGVLGCAAIAERMVIPAILSSTKYKLIAVASRTLDKAKQYADKFHCEAIEGYENLLNRNDIDAVYIPLPTGLHAEWGIKSLQSGKHVLIEKSLAANYGDAINIVELAKEKKLLVQENSMFEYHRQFSVIREILKENRLGALRCIRSSFGFPPFPDKDNIRYNPELGGGALLDAGAYTIKIASLLAEEKPKVIGASLKIDDERGVDIFGGIMMKYTNGCVVETAFGFDHFYQCSLEIWGSKGKLTADRIFTAGPGVSPNIYIETKEEKAAIPIEPDNHFVNLLNHFAEQIENSSLAKTYESLIQQAALLNDVKIAAQKN